MTDLSGHEGRVAIVTGAASGIGRASVERIVRLGGSVVALDRNASGFDWLTDFDLAASVEVFAGDVTDVDTNVEAVARSSTWCGPLRSTWVPTGSPSTRCARVPPRPG